MRKFTKSLLTLALMVLAVGSANAEKLQSDFSEIATQGQATWDAETNTMGWSTSWSNALAYFMIKGIDNVGGYYDLSSWKTITITISDLSETTNGVRIRMKDNTGGDGDWILMTKGTNTINISDFKKGGNTLDYKHIGGIQLSGGNSTSGASTATFTEMYLERPDDPLALPKDQLSAAIDFGKAQNSFAKTAESFAALTNAISDAESILTSATTPEELTNAKTAINDAYVALKLEDGYVNLTKSMFHTWSGIEDDATITGAGGCDLNLNTLLTGNGMLYGNPSVLWNQYAKIVNAKSFVVLGLNGASFGARTDRLEVGNGSDDPNGGSLTTVNINIGEDGKWVMDLSEKASLRINAIKGAGYVTDLLIEYKPIPVTLSAAGYTTFSADLNVKASGVKAYAAKVDGNKVMLKEVTEVPAGAGVIIEAAADNYELPVINDAAAISAEDNQLLVSDGTIKGDDIYVLAKKSKGLGFYKLAATDAVPAGKAYLKIADEAREFIAIAGETTGIETVKTVKAEQGIFNMAGQRLVKAQKGLNIINGKKVMK